MVDSLYCLRHHPVVSRHHDNGDVGDLGPAGTHSGEGLVTRSIDKGNLAALVSLLQGHLVGTNVLGNTASFAFHHVGVANSVQQLGLAVVYVTHHGDHRRSCFQGVDIVQFLGRQVNVKGFQQFAILVLGGNHLDVVAQLGPQQGEGVFVQGLRGGNHLSHVEQHRHQSGGVDRNLVGEI